MPKKKKVWKRKNNFKADDTEDEIPPELLLPKEDPSIPKVFELITREQWGAQPGYAYRPLHTPVRKLRIIYDLNMDRCKNTKSCKKFVFGIQRRHLHLGWPDINLNFVVAGDGNVYEGLGWNKKIIRLPHHSVETGHTLAIGCIGRYNRQTVPRRMKKALDDFIKKSVEEGHIVKEIFNGEYWRIKQCCKLPREMPFGEVTRFEWGALESKARMELWNPVMKILVMYGTNSKPCFSKEECTRTVREIQISDMYVRRMPDLNYNFLIGGDGNVYEGRGFAKKPTAFSDYIPNSLIVGFIGDWAVRDPPDMFEDIFLEFCRLYIKEGKISPTWKRYFVRGY